MTEKIKTSELKFNEPLAQHTSWHVGGLATRYFRPKSIPDLLEFLPTIPADEPIVWLGLGSNVLVSDKGINGTVIHTLGMGESNPSIISVENIPMENNPEALSSVLVRAEAGIPCAKLAKFCVKHGLQGGEFFAGIPGTVGGALAMNAGAFGGETWPCVEKVEVVNRQGQQIIRTSKDYNIGYRTVERLSDKSNNSNAETSNSEKSSEEWFLAGYFRFKPGDSSKTSDQIKQLLRRRSETQPIGVFSCGSVFTNPENDFAGRLIESLNLKGHRIGDAEISPKHANFIINHGNATAQDVLQLIHYAAEKVWEHYGVRLKTEVRLLGF